MNYSDCIFAIGGFGESRQIWVGSKTKRQIGAERVLLDH
jgi:hypothetical protein